MSRFVFGAVSGAALSVSALSVVSVMVPLSAQKTPPLVEQVEVQAEAPMPKPATPQVEPTPEKVAEARAAFNKPLIEDAAEVLQKPVADLTPKVPDRVAVASASFAEEVRKRLGVLPDENAKEASTLVDLSTTPKWAGDEMRAAKPKYFEVWDDLMQRCYATVALGEPMDETGLTVTGDDRINYAQAYTEQKWYAVDKAFSIRVRTREGDARSGILRTCVLESNRFALVKSATVRELKGRFHDWWARERLAGATTDLEYPYTLSDKHRWYGGLTRFGSVQGCAIKVEFSEITLGGETEAKLFLTESDKEDCSLTPGTGSGPGGKVRVNRLPQAGG